MFPGVYATHLYGRGSRSVLLGVLSTLILDGEDAIVRVYGKVHLRPLALFTFFPCCFGIVATVERSLWTLCAVDKVKCLRQ